MTKRKIPDEAAKKQAAEKIKRTRQWLSRAFPKADLCMICGDPEPVKRGLCQACYKMAQRLVYDAETTWLELTLAGCCAGERPEHGHLRKRILIEKLAEYRAKKED